MMVPILNAADIEKMKTSGLLLAEIFEIIAPRVAAGVTTAELDSLIEQEISSRTMIAGSMGYMGYKHVSCISLNDEVVHGIPSAKRIIKAGDIVKVDVCAAYQGFFADMARTFLIEPVNKQVQEFAAVAYAALDRGIEKAVAGNRLSDISAAIQLEVERHGFGVVRDFAGHGIGRAMHEDPEILNYGVPGRGPRLLHGMGLALEPMITMKGYGVFVAQNGWTAKTVDGSLAAHVEDTVIITDNGPMIITRPYRG
jgi:methionyl aminopeptidase